MSHAPVSVIVTASGSPDDLHACLQSLRPTLGAADEAVCVVPPGRPDLRRELAANRWLKVLDAEPEDQAGRWAAGLAATTHPIVLLLDGDVIGSPRWLEQVTRAFGDPEVVAAGPRCHRSYGPQGVTLPQDAMVSVASFKAHARQWYRQHRDELTTVDRLGPVCVAVRRTALDRAGGPTLHMPYDALAQQGRIVVVERALVAHVGTDRCALREAGTAARPFLSASMIVKDEEDVLGTSLDALREFVDEIVVYDTGSTDRSVQIARDRGARVVEGYWNDHFGDARNRSLAHCRGEWIFVVDADEVASGDPATLRTELSVGTAPGRLVLVQSTEGFGREGRGIMAPRLFRRGGRYTGRLHEQAVDGVTGEKLTGPEVLAVQLAHSGYDNTRLAAKNKGVRNVHLAELAVAEEGDSHAALANLARSHMFAGRVSEAVAASRQGLADGGGPYRDIFYQLIVHGHGADGNLGEALATLDEARRAGCSPFVADELEARVRMAQGEHAAALALVERFPERALDATNLVLSRRQLADVEITCRYQLGAHAEAAELLSECLRRGDFVLAVATMATVLQAAGRDAAATIAALVPRAKLRGLLLSLTEAPTPLADELLEAFWQRYPGDAAVLAFAARAGAQLPLLRCLEWAARLRQGGFADSCTLVSLAGAPFRTPRERVLAAAVALEMYGDERAMPLLSQALPDVPAPDAAGVLAEMRLLAPRVAAAVEPATQHA